MVRPDPKIKGSQPWVAAAVMGHRSNNYSESKRNDHLDNNRRQEQRNKGFDDVGLRYRWEELGLVGRISTLGIKWKGQDFKGTWWSALASWALEVYKKLGGRWVSKRVYGYGRMQEVLVWMKVWKMRENLDVDSCDSDSLRMLQCSCAFLSGFAEKEDVRGWESDLVDSFEKAQFLMISGDCGNVTTDDNEDVTPVIAPEKDSIIAPPSTPPGNDLNIAVESGSSGLLIIGPLNSDEIDSDKRWSYRNPMGI
ncbi:hypothetical protein Tco_1042160 [Tanacetum coccineum]|uniref:Uncharacterized protein n=1 Tax=Tanacetum coccineum TaxID=301880 RepID=A0ABQ5GJJ7_9ASTR